ncbi:glycoside hydrolase family 32 protein [Litchfieldia salsa]|uniref:Sucrose-6-phosphate hydrolase n=1 Tax=Litchfieldia salsa TaxID=930152 RepID=A0A1H0RRM9_9BACI|nr:sucrose-6-phosphate hydrolase [Litchfieldia salsa]SDP32117.1 beta-fructofuranosidase [Litchfieldia salsa]
MEWTKESRYRRLEQASKSEMHELTSKVNASQWRQTFHIQPTTGLLNDPNGFSFYHGEYHLFYQWFPLGPVHGLKYWYHTKSKDLVNWENVGIAIEPREYFESHGSYSGSAIEYEGKLHLLYTGNTRDQNWNRKPYQCLAIMDESLKIKKLDDPVISKVPAGYTDHFRDPKVWKEEDNFYMIIGAQRSDETGCVVLYKSDNLTEWEFEGELKTGLEDFGYMWECPDYFELNGLGCLVFSPQGISPQDDFFNNIYQSGYIVGEELNLETKEFEHGEFYELDRGFDFYAPQTMLDGKGRRLLVGWMGLPEIDYPTDSDGWAHCLTLPRELSLKDGKLIQQPVEELQLLRKDELRVNGTIENQVISFDDFSGDSYELICEFYANDAEEFGIEFRASDDEKTVLKYDSLKGKLMLDRSLSGEEVGKEYGAIRQCSMAVDKLKLHLFVDISSVEIFVNDGQEVFTSRIFPKANSRDIRFFSKHGTVKFQATKFDF